MFIDLRNKRYLVEWQHYPHTKCPGTDCSIYEDLGPGSRPTALVALGSTSLHPSDHNRYSKETGRKMSLARALVEMKVSREERGTVWKQYFARFDNHIPLRPSPIPEEAPSQNG